MNVLLVDLCGPLVEDEACGALVPFCDNLLAREKQPFLEVGYLSPHFGSTLEIIDNLELDNVRVSDIPIYRVNKLLAVTQRCCDFRSLGSIAVGRSPVGSFFCGPNGCIQKKMKLDETGSN